jgi:L,D-transpeptidase YcbB
MTVLATLAGPAAAMPAPMPDRAAVAAALLGDGLLVVEGRPLNRVELAALYQKRDFKAIWDEDRSQSLRRALDEAPSHGLDSLDFAAKAANPTERELLLTDAFLRYASALARGRVYPSHFESDWRIASPGFDAQKVLDAALAEGIEPVLAALAPHDPAYERLRAALAHYRALAKTGWPSLHVTATMRPGDRGEAVRALRERLADEDFIGPSEPDSDPALYDGALSEAVSHFQETHGLAVDGMAGRMTIAALNVPAAARERQIRLNLERWRSLPRFDAPTRIDVNAAAATAVLYQDDVLVKTMRVVVGSLAHPTPVLRARMISVLVNPPWNVPSSIIENEIRPALKHDPRYLKRGGYIYAEDEAGRRLVQLPGPKNALGQIKFEMPNPDDIYMHDTPDRRLFAHARRAVSHGCVRVEDPRGLAQRVIDSETWTEETIDQAIATGETQRIPLAHKIPVYMLYWTAFVDPDDTVEFRDDVYGRDKRLAEALAVEEAAGHVAATANNRSKG